MSSENDLLRQQYIENDAVYSSILSRISDAVVALDKDWRYTFVNEQAAALFGRTPADLVGKHIWTEFPEGVGQPFHLHYEEAMREQRPFCFEDYYAPWDRWFENRLYPSPDGITIFFQEITERKKTEEQIRTYNQLLQTIIDTAPIRVFWKNTDLQYLGCNKAFAKDAGFNSEEDIIGKDDYQMGWKDQAELYRSDDRITIDSGLSRLSYEEPQTKPDGGLMWLNTSKVPLINEANKVIGVLGVYEDITDRKIIEEAVRQSEAKFRSIVETSQEWIWETDLSWHHMYSNERIVDILGYSRDEFLDLNFMELIHQDEIGELEALLPELIARKKGWRSLALRCRHKDGSYRLLESSADPILNEAGELVGYRGTDRDITDQNNAEKKLRETEELFNLFMRYTPVYTYIKQIEGDKSRVIQLSDNFINMLGRPAEELRGHTMEELFPPDFARKITDDDIAVVKAGNNIQIDEDLNGRSYVTIKFPILREGKDNLLAGYTIDITDRKQAEQEISQYVDIVQNMQVGLYVYHLENIEDDSTLTLIAANPKSARLIGLSEHDIIGRVIDDIFPGLRNAGIPEKFANVVRTGKAMDVEEFIYSDQNVKEACFAFKAFPLSDNRVGVLFEDITIRKNAEAALQDINRELEQRVEERTTELGELNKELQAFNYSISHDMRAPLLRIKGFADVLFDVCAAKLSEEELQYISRLKTASKRMDEHIEALLKLYQINRYDFYQEPVDLSALAEKIINDLQNLDSERKVTFTATAGIVVDADKMLMKEFLDNLISNAWRYTAGKDDAKIEFGKTRQDGRDLYFIRDNGVGFNSDQIDNIFTPFLRLHTEDTGLGIGLASVQRIIRLHGGKIWAESQENKGATFYFTLK